MILLFFDKLGVLGKTYKIVQKWEEFFEKLKEIVVEIRPKKSMRVARKTPKGTPMEETQINREKLKFRHVFYEDDQKIGLC